MRVLKVNVQDAGDTGGAVVRLSRAEIGTINKLMFQADMKGNTRAQFFLLYELVSHGCFDRFDMEEAQHLMEQPTGKETGKEGKA